MCFDDDDAFNNFLVQMFTLSFETLDETELTTDNVTTDRRPPRNS